jgi:hypothetical protein
MIGETASCYDLAEKLRQVRLQVATEAKVLRLLIQEDCSPSFIRGVAVGLEAVERIRERLTTEENHVGALSQEIGSH